LEILLPPTRFRTLHSIAQYRLNPARCQRVTVSGKTIIRVSFHRDQNRSATIQKSLSSGPSFGLGNVELAAKYRFLHQDSFGLDVALFPRVFLPSPTKNIGNSTAALLLPIWVQKDWSGGWSAFGGGGCIVGRSSQNFCLMGGVVNYQVLPKLQLGVELFHQTADSSGTPAMTSLGIGARYDIDANYHLLGYIRRGIENTDETNQYSWYASVLFTF